MPLTLHQNLIDSTKKVHADSPWLFLWYFEVDITTSASTVLRLVRYPTEITPLALPAPHVGKKFYPFPMSWSDYTEEGEANLPRMQLTLENASRLFSQHLENGQGFIGNLVSLFLIPLDLHLDTPVGGEPPFWIQRNFHVVDAGVDSQDVVLGLELPNFYERLYPEQIYNPNRCRFRFGLQGGGCPYVLSTAAAHDDCSKELVECSTRGLDMASRGYPKRLLPERFGGFPGTDIRN